MTAQVVDINMVRLERLFGGFGHRVSLPQLTRTVVKKQTCPFCEGFGLLRYCNGQAYPVGFDEARQGRFPTYVCQHCAGVGSLYTETQAEAV